MHHHWCGVSIILHILTVDFRKFVLNFSYTERNPYFNGLDKIQLTNLNRFLFFPCRFINGVYTFLLNLSLGRIFEGLQFHDFTFTDTVVFLGLLPLGLIGIGVHLKYFFGLKTVLPKLNQDLVVLSADLGISVQQIQSITRRNVGSTAILAGLIMASGLLCWGFEYLFIRSYFQTFISSLAFSGEFLNICI